MWKELKGQLHLSEEQHQFVGKVRVWEWVSASVRENLNEAVFISPQNTNSPSLLTCSHPHTLHRSLIYSLTSNITIMCGTFH